MFPNAHKPHPYACSSCMEDDRSCTWIVYNSAPPRGPAPVESCDQCARRGMYCDWPPATDSKGDIVVPPTVSPYVPGADNETEAARRARVLAWTSKPDKPTNPKFFARWKADICLWNNRGNAPLSPNVSTKSPNTKRHHRPPPKAPKPQPQAPQQPPPKQPSSPPALDPFVAPFVPARPKTPPIKIDVTPPPTQKPPNFSSNSIHPEPANVIDLDPHPVIDLDPEPVPTPSLDDVIEECIKKYGDKAVLFWFAKKVDLSEEIRRVGKYVPSTSSAATIASLTQSMVESLYEHWSVFDPNSEKEVHARVRLIQRLKSLVAHFIMYPPSSESTDPSTSSSDKGKKRAFNQD
ncbi:uncharacterized protein MELLADRAFT_94768 [Melampsora larici-populina 98AG31]|uniref:Zn(2)-C6 fungal-type domain-containing protein n=1 Tax=Melampsora larici-populina (strain 98AG31 / pathotype 3-4-7) TaxID=747676 RepID=F4S7U9_MELLP|nr:uncharacterized protein MELLADRAFT_94768 [Melampsora larici-populina 98AG31]EGF99272.1 hypothetical protein MELLADRAFT_94768 [Melampsora larici-populina 98AG31]